MTYTILVIEDEDSVRENIRDILELKQFRVLTATDGHLGVKLAQQYSPDLVICDVVMPGMNGYTVLKTLHRTPQTAITPFIFLTAKSTLGDIRHGMELGADDYLVKPFSAEALLRAIATRLEKNHIINQRIQHEVEAIAARLDYLIHYDSLTCLPNRATLEKRFQQLTERVGADARSLIPLLVVGLDPLHRLTEAQGYRFSDDLIATIAMQLQRYAENRSDIHTIARLNNYQFALLLPPTDSKNTAIQVAEAVQQVIAQPVLLDGRHTIATSSIGIAVYPSDSRTLCHLITCAEMAVNQATRQGGDRYQVYTPALSNATSERRSLEAALEIALEQSEFEAYYQPQIDLRTGQVVSAEALVRWQHPERGLILPSKFIPVAEATGFIVPLGEWMLRKVCEQIKRWQNQNLRPIPVAVNLSGLQFNQANLHHQVLKILDDVGLQPQYLELELTESVLMSNVDKAVDTLNALRRAGVRVSIDDFGVAYSSLNYLQQFMFDTLKIARPFVHHIECNSSNAAIATAIIQMAHSLGLRVVGEGVETNAELAYLQTAQCDVVQGYIFSYPLPVQSFTAMLAEKRTYPIPSFAYCNTLN